MNFEAQYEIVFLGWKLDPEKNADKIWGWARVEDKLYNFWAGRNKKLKFKRHDCEFDLEGLTRSKARKGYREINDIDTFLPDFHAEFKKQLATARIFGKVRGEGFDD